MGIDGGRYPGASGDAAGHRSPILLQQIQHLAVQVMVASVVAIDVVVAPIQNVEGPGKFHSARPQLANFYSCSISSIGSNATS